MWCNKLKHAIVRMAIDETRLLACKDYRWSHCSRHLMQALKQAMTLTDRQSEPKNDEAKRVLKFFMSSLLNSHMPRPLEYAKMRSLTTLVPHYSEDVIYPLDSDEVKERTGKDVTPNKMTNLVGSMKGMEITTLDFLRIQFEDEWDNFLERLVDNWQGKITDADGNVIDLSKVNPDDITVNDFTLKSKSGLFSREPGARMDLMMWASERGQLLARTVRGMMMYQQALELFEPLEAADPRQRLPPEFFEAKFRCAHHALFREHASALSPLLLLAGKDAIT